MTPCSLSDAALWDSLRKAHKDFGIASWTQKGVPFHVTNNSLIAYQYAQIALPFFSKGSVTFLEIGAGSAKFAYLFLAELFRLGVSKRSVRYILTDLAEKNVSFWKQHPLFRAWIEEGIVCPRVYDPLESKELPGSFDLVIANYFFDAIAQDLFRIEKGQLLEGRVVLEKENLSELSLNYSYHLIEESRFPYFDSPQLEAILNLYRRRLERGTFLFPSAGLKMLEKLCFLSQTPLTLLAADRGIADGNQAASEEAPALRLHGTFSFPVNFHAIAQFFLQRGGCAHFPEMISSSFVVGLFSLGTLPSSSVFFLKEQHFDALGSQQDGFKKQLDHLVAAHWDAALFFSYFDTMESLFEKASTEEKKLFLKGCAAVGDRFYPLFQEEALLLEKLGVFLSRCDEEREAEALFALAETFKTMDKLGKNLDVLQIGEPAAGWQIEDQERTMIPLSLEALEAVGEFDLILFFPQNLPQPAPWKMDLIQEIEMQFPNLHEIVYKDQDLDRFLTQIDPLHIKSLPSFFISLEARRQITSEQLQKVLTQLGVDLLQPASQAIDCFALLLCALKYHMRKGGTLKGVFPLSFKDDRFLNEIVVDPYLEYREEIYSSPAGEEFLQMQIQKIRC